jgi:hypothetical protein
MGTLSAAPINRVAGCLYEALESENGYDRSDISADGLRAIHQRSKAKQLQPEANAVTRIFSWLLSFVRSRGSISLVFLVRRPICGQHPPIRQRKLAPPRHTKLRPKNV